MVAPGKLPSKTEEPQETMRARSFLDKWIIAGGESICLLFLASGVIIVYEVFVRYLLDSPTIWVHETTVFVCSLCFAYGGCYCIACDKHIRIVLLYGSVSRRWKRRLNIGISLMGVVFGISLSWAAWTIAEKALFAPWGEFRMETSGSAWSPPFPAISKGFLVLILVVMTLQFVLHTIYYLRNDEDV